MLKDTIAENSKRIAHNTQRIDAIMWYLRIAVGLGLISASASPLWHPLMGAVAQLLP